jgi:hypothetical protein
LVTWAKQVQKMLALLDEFSDGNATLRSPNDAKAIVEYLVAKLSNKLKVARYGRASLTRADVVVVSCCAKRLRRVALSSTSCD